MANVVIIAQLNDTTNRVQKQINTTITTAGEKLDLRIVPVGTSETTFTIDAGVGDAGYCWLRNADTTNFVQVGFATGAYYIKLAAGDCALFPMVAAQAALYMLADTAACNVEVYVHEA